MKTLMISAAVCTLLAACDDGMQLKPMASAPPDENKMGTILPTGEKDLETTIKSWPEKPKEAVMMMKEKYGEPEVISDHMIAWKETGQFKFTKIMDKEIAHEFPMAHTDFMEQGIEYKVPVDKVGPLAEYDGSVIVDRTKGCLSARCDKEENNILALNLAHDIITGKRTAQEARLEFARIAMAAKKGQKDPYMEKLQFTSPSGETGDRDKPVTEADLTKAGKR